MDFLTHAKQKHPKCRLVVIGFSSLAALIALFVIFGWVTQTTVLVRVSPHLFPMPLKTALLQLFTSLGVLAFILDYRKTSWIITVIATIFSITSAIQLFWGFNFESLKMILNREEIFASGYWGSPTPSAMICFLLLSIALIFLCLLEYAPSLVWGVAAVGLIIIILPIANLYSFFGGYKIAKSAQDLRVMSVHTSVGLLLLGICLLLVASCVVSLRSNRLRYLLAISAFMILLTSSFALHEIVLKQARRNLRDLLDVDANQVGRLLLARFEDNYLSNVRFLDRLKILGEKGMSEEYLEIDTKNYLRDKLGMVAIFVVNKGDGSIQSFYDPETSKERENALKKAALPPEEGSKYFHLKEGKRGLNVLTYEQSLTVRGVPYTLVFVYDPDDFFRVGVGKGQLGKLEEIGVSVNGVSVYSNIINRDAHTVGVSRNVNYQDLSINLEVFASTLFEKKFMGTIPEFIFVPAFLLACLGAALVFILQRVNALNANLKVSNATKSLFLANVSHEIRTPLHGILGTSSLLEITKLDTKQMKYLNMIMFSARYLLDLVNNLLDITKFESQSLVLEYEQHDLRKLCEEQLQVMLIVAKQREIELKFNYQSDTEQLPFISVNALKQMVTNLIGNALKFTEEGSITLSVQLKGEGFVIIEVADTGIGIPADKLSLLFNKFSRIDEPQAAQKGGTGLGLYLTKLLAEKMGGKVSVESVFGKGTTFRVTFPVQFHKKR